MPGIQYHGFIYVSDHLSRGLLARFRTFLPTAQLAVWSFSYNEGLTVM